MEEVYTFFFVPTAFGVRHQAGRVKQFGAGSVLGWATAVPRPAYRNAERGRSFFQRL